MIKILAVGFIIFLFMALLTGIWGQLQRIQEIMQRGMWQRDQYLKKMCDLIVKNYDTVITFEGNLKKGDNEND